MVTDVGQLCLGGVICGGWCLVSIVVCGVGIQ